MHMTQCIRSGYQYDHISTTMQTGRRVLLCVRCVLRQCLEKVIGDDVFGEVLRGMEDVCISHHFTSIPQTKKTINSAALGLSKSASECRHCTIT